MNNACIHKDVIKESDTRIENSAPIDLFLLSPSQRAQQQSV